MIDWLFILVFAFVILFFIGIFVVIVWYSRNQAKKRKQQLEELARRFGLRIKKGGWFKTDRAVGRYKDFQATVQIFHKSSGKHSYPVTQVLMVYKKGHKGVPSFFSFVRPVVSSSSKFLFGGSLNTASPEFNKTFSTKGRLARRVLSSDVQHLMLELSRMERFDLQVFVPEKGYDGVIILTNQTKLRLDSIFVSKVLDLAFLVSKKMQENPLGYSD
ncbi:hypothetical protein K8R43_03435 [archaeon]|nr:hypothetical protein [archaeon]